MECGCHVDDKVGSLAVQEQKFLIVRQESIWVERNSVEGGKKIEYQEGECGISLEVVGQRLWQKSQDFEKLIGGFDPDLLVGHSLWQVPEKF